MFRKVTLLEISKSPLLIRFTGLQYIVCNAAKNKLLIKVFWNLQKISRKWSLIWFLIRNTQIRKLQLSALRVFKTPEITSMAKFLSSEAANTPRKLASVFEKDFTIDVLLHKKLRKAKIKASKGKKICNADADAEIPMLRFPNGRNKLLQFLNFCY